MSNKKTKYYVDHCGGDSKDYSSLSYSKPILTESDLKDIELTKFLLNELLDDIDFLNLYEQKDRVVEIENEIKKQIKAQDNIKLVVELSNDLDNFFKNGGDYNSLETRIKKVSTLDDYHDSIMNIYDIYLDNIYKFVLFEAFIGRKTLLEDVKIKEIVNNKLIKQIVETIHNMPKWFNERIKELDKATPEDSYRYLDTKIMSTVFYSDDIMTYELKEKLFVEETKAVNNKQNETITKIKKKKSKLLKLRLLLGTFILGGAISLGSMGVSIKNAIKHHNVTTETNSLSESDKAILSLITFLAILNCIAFNRLSASRVRDLLDLDEERYNKLCELSNQLNVIHWDVILKVVHKIPLPDFLKTDDSDELFIDSFGRIEGSDGTRREITLLDHKENNIPIPEIRTDLKEEEEEYMKKLARQTIKDVIDADIEPIREFGKDYSSYFDEFGRLILPDGVRMSINNNGSEKELEENLREVLKEVTGNSYAKKM